MLLGRCRRLLSSWSLSTNFTKLVTCWLLPTHVEMTINGLMSWRILTLKALIRLWEWDLTPYFHKLALIPKIWKLAILPCGKTTWIPTCDLLGKGGSWIQNTLTTSLRQPMALSWEGTTWSDPFSSRIPFLFKQWWSGSGGRVGHKGSPLVERHKFLVLGGSPNRQCSGTRTWHTAINK